MKSSFEGRALLSFSFCQGGVHAYFLRNKVVKFYAAQLQSVASCKVQCVKNLITSKTMKVLHGH